jgi:hypothetical protein
VPLPGTSGTLAAAAAAALVDCAVSVDPPGDTQPIAAQRVRIKHVDVERLMVPRDCNDGGVYSRAAEHLSISLNVFALQSAG